ncbi:MAG: hypothetical protein NT007_03985 [Candidatus Kapabacteria bacterium]|nr:hypothetical protein [Candidatus Kapabacteria bacterium]
MKNCFKYSQRNAFLFLNNLLEYSATLDNINQILKLRTGISNFFDSEDDFKELDFILNAKSNILEQIERDEYGDFQTNSKLTSNVTTLLLNKAVRPDIIIEPTCGKGSFIIECLKQFPNSQKIYGIEIYQPYVWETKFSILEYFLNNNAKPNTEIVIICADIFEFDFNSIKQNHHGQSFLLIGNPPWATNSGQSSVYSENIPNKTNFKHEKGFDAINGKANFDISEYILLSLIFTFQDRDGEIAFLLKSSVIKNMVFDQIHYNYSISNIESYDFDSKKEFEIQANTALLICKLNSGPEYTCLSSNLYNHNPNNSHNIKNIHPSQNTNSSLTHPKVNHLKEIDSMSKSFGWSNEKFVSNILLYQQTKEIDGHCTFEWRQGVKHDCAQVMEFDKTNEIFHNELCSEINLEPELVYGMIKSSDLKGLIVDRPRKYTIITQTKPGQKTEYIKLKFPLTYNYLIKNKTYFDKRRSRIYNNNPPFAIFGIGDYSFAPYKVAISGMYKNYSFKLVTPENGKPLMLDDTCYFLSFDTISDAVFCNLLLNSGICIAFLKSITFLSSKRTFTKEILKRIDLKSIIELIKPEEIKRNLEIINAILHQEISFDSYYSFIDKLNKYDVKKGGLF